MGWGQLSRALNAMLRQAYEKGSHERWGMIRAISGRPPILPHHLAQKGSTWLMDGLGWGGEAQGALRNLLK